MGTKGILLHMVSVHGGPEHISAQCLAAVCKGPEQQRPRVIRRVPWSTTVASSSTLCFLSS